MASSVAPKNRDLLECIRRCHPKVKITVGSAYFHSAKDCLSKLVVHLHGEREDFEECCDYTSRQFVNYVRRRYSTPPVNRHFDRLKELKYFEATIEFRKLSSGSSAPPPPPAPPQAKKAKLSTFDELGKRQQDRRTSALRKQHEGSALVSAAIQHLRTISNDAAYVLKKLQDDPTLAADMRKAISDPPKEVTKISCAQASGLILDRGLTKTDWEEIARSVNSCGVRVVPGWDTIYEEKVKNRPDGKALALFVPSFIEGVNSGTHLKKIR